MKWLQQNAIQLLFILFSGIALYVGSESRLTALELKVGIAIDSIKKVTDRENGQDLQINKNTLYIENLSEASIKMAPVITRLSDSLMGLERVLTAEQADKARILDHITSVRASQEKTEKKIEELSQEVQSIKLTMAAKGQ